MPPLEPGSPRLRRLLLLLAAVGSLLFTGLLALSVIEPLWIERAARELLRQEVERRVGERVDQLSNARVLQIAQKRLGHAQAQIEARRQALRAEVPQRVAHAMADLLKADCECRRRMVDVAVRHEEGALASLEQLRERLSRLIESAYGEVSRQLMREFRIFSGVNAAAFALLFLVTLMRRGQALQLLLPAAVLVGAAAFTAVVYLLGQNWLHTIVFGDYVGWAYVAWYGMAAGWFADLLCNRGRVSTLLLQLIGSVSKGAPC